MKETSLCQSCSMPIDSVDDCGTEKDGSPHPEYCKYCYQQGAFTIPDLSLAKMQSIVHDEMEKQDFPESLIQKALAILPNLKRWNKNMINKN